MARIYCASTYGLRSFKLLDYLQPDSSNFDSVDINYHPTRW